MIDLMDDFEKLIRLEIVLFHQAAKGRAVTPIVVLLQVESFFGRDFEEIGNVIANALVNLLPQIEMVRIKRVIEIEDPGLDFFEVRGIYGRWPAATTRTGRRSRRLLVAIFLDEEVWLLPNHHLKKSNPKGEYAAPWPIDATCFA